MMELILAYESMQGPGTVYYTPANPEIAQALGIEKELKIGETSEQYANWAAEQLVADGNKFIFKKDILVMASSNPPKEVWKIPTRTAEEKLTSLFNTEISGIL